MSTKFFTWTKGERKSASEALRKDGIVPIPAECISIKGLGHGRSLQYPRKAKGRPALILPDGSPELPYAQNHRTNDSIALHDAAVQSATSLMAVMNDMLRSPPMSSHLFAQTYPPRQNPMYGRPRSRTAPPTPLAEAPSTEYVELPGSTPVTNKPLVNGAFTDVPASQPIFDIQHAFGAELTRPHSNPQKPTSTSLILPSAQNAHLSPRIERGRTINESNAPSGVSRSECIDPKTSIGEIADYPERSNPSGSIQLASSIPLSLATSRSASASHVPHNRQPDPQPQTQQQQQQQQQHGTGAEPGTSLLGEFAALRQTHEAHVESVKMAHERELASYRTYISLLEKQQSNVRLRRDAELIEKATRAEASDRALRNAIADLESRLVAANNERTDVLEGYHDACAKIRELCQWQSNTSPDSPKQTTGTPRHKRATSDVVRFTATSGPMWKQMQELRRELASKEAHNHQLQQQIADQSTKIETEGARVVRLEDALAKNKMMLDSTRADSERYNSLLHHEIRRQTRDAVDKTHSSSIPRIEAEAFVVATERMIRLQAQPIDTARNIGSSSGDRQPTYAALERELDHCIKEIIMYKLDLKHYRKELRKAHAKLNSNDQVEDSNQSFSDLTATTMDRDALQSQTARITLTQQLDTPAHTPSPVHPGLGISLPAQSRLPSQDIASATSAALTSPSHPAQPSPLASPGSRPRTPLGAHKRLPKPPGSSGQRSPFPPSPPPSSSKVQRGETLRSLSESIIMSRGK